MIKITLEEIGKDTGFKPLVFEVDDLTITVDSPSVAVLERPEDPSSYKRVSTGVTNISIQATRKNT